MRRSPFTVSIIVLSLMAVSCSPGASGDNPVAVFQVADEQYRIELASEELVDQARQILDDGGVTIPIGMVIRDDPGVNEPWSWHIDPETLEFAEITIEVCDGLPSFVEEGIITSTQFCPWSAILIEIEGLDNQT